MLIDRRTKILSCGLVLLLIITGCRNPSLSWRSGQLVAQLYRQYNQEILLAYNDTMAEMVVDQQHGYARAYFDNYRKEIIFSAQGTLDYMVGGRQFTTEDSDVTGYVFEVLMNDLYQIGVEIIDVKDGTRGKGQFWGSKSRIIDLNNSEYVVVDGLLFNRNMMAGHYFYGFTFDDNENQFLDIIDLRTMHHQRFNTTENEITFLYQMGDTVYGQSEATKTTFLFNGLEMREVKEKYKKTLTGDKSNWYILKDVAPVGSREHWYIDPVKNYDIVMRARLLRLMNGGTSVSILNFERDDIIQLMDVSNYGNDKVAAFVTTKDDDGILHALIYVFDLEGNKISMDEITNIRGENGRFTYLDYVE